MGAPLQNPELALELGLTVPVGAGCEPCPSCDGNSIWPEVSFEEHYGMYCARCGWTGPRASAPDGDPDEALAAWNREARLVRQARELGLAVNLTQPRGEDCCG